GASLSNLRKKPAIAPPVFVFQKDKGQKSSAEQKDLSDSGEEPQGEAEAPHHGTGHPESAGEHALEPPAPASTSASTPPLPAPEAQLPFPRELAGMPLNPQSHFGLGMTAPSILGDRDPCTLDSSRLAGLLACPQSRQIRSLLYEPASCLLLTPGK
uniref:RAN binding protein 3 n=1 Tax=Spermophilus dauricus TaxID=99837 RepID=A0A8C9PKT2_SPEDA